MFILYMQMGIHRIILVFISTFRCLMGSVLLLITMTIMMIWMIITTTTEGVINLDQIT